MSVRRLLVPVVTAAALVAAAPAQARPPEHFSFPETGEEPVFASCDGFDIALSTVGTNDVTVFFDDAGDVLRVSVHTSVRDTFTNSVTGKVVVNRGNFTESFTRIGESEDFNEKLVGYRFMASLPGQPHLLFDVGQLREGPDGQITFIAGQHHVPDDSDATLFCAALA